MIEYEIKEKCVYITKGGYVVEIVGRDFGLPLASLRTSPGVNITGDDASEMTPNGWTYSKNGRMYGLTNFWNENLEIVAQICDLTKLDFNNLPPNIHLVDGYPMVKKESSDSQEKGKSDMPGYTSYDISENPYEDIIDKSCKKFFKELDISKYMKIVEDKPFTAPKPTEMKPPNPTVEFGKRMFTYWLYEPTKIMAIQVAKSVRYALVLSILGSAGYGSFHPDQIKNFVAKCLPKVSVGAPEIMR